jgi:hypothetical protein
MNAVMICFVLFEFLDSVTNEAYDGRRLRWKKTFYSKLE